MANLNGDKKLGFILFELRESPSKILTDFFNSFEFEIKKLETEKDLYQELSKNTNLSGILFYDEKNNLQNLQSIIRLIKKIRNLPVFIICDEINQIYKNIQENNEFSGIIYLNMPKNIIQATLFIGINNFQQNLDNRTLIEKSAAILKALPDLIFVINKRGDIIDYNASKKELLYVPPEQFLGKNISQILPPAVAELIKVHLLECISQSITSIFEYSLEMENKTAYFECRMSLYSTEKVLAIIRDITQKQKLLEASEKNQKLESLGILAGGIAHDFNNLLAGIFGNVGIAHSITTEPEVKEYLSATLETLDRARSLTQQLLTFSKSGVPNKKVENVIPIIQKTAQFALSGTNATCTYDLPIDLQLCEIDQNQISQVIENIVINAIQAMPNGGSITISVKNISLKSGENPALAEGNYIRIEIKDSGIGIPKSIQKQIFDPFFTTKQKGSGLGLAISYSIINRHGGTIEVESESDKGSTFYIYLPAAKTQKKEEVKQSSKLYKGYGTILVMDDEQIILKMLTNMLNHFGFTVICAENGEKALDQFINSNHGANLTAVILDLTIHGGMGGKETIKEIRKLNQIIPVFVISGYAEDPILVDPQSYGFNAALKKPFSIEDLNHLLRTHLKRI